MKPYQRIAIVDCAEPLVDLPTDRFARVEPHPYAALGAPYGQRSPFAVRQGVRDRLLVAHDHLQQLRPGWRIQIFDAYRPVAVQQFMVAYTLDQVLEQRGWSRQSLTPHQHQAALEQVHQFWAVPNRNPLTPPPHSTGAAIDITLVDETGTPVAMGGAIDELSPRSYPDHYIGLADPEAQQFDNHRQLLHYCLSQVGFQRHYHEWWHFSYGDQLWAWLMGRGNLGRTYTACYGRVE
jgi:D-alanyl-D-alanine dipeptidase